MKHHFFRRFFSRFLGMALLFGLLLHNTTSADEMWDIFSKWQETGKTSAGDAHFIALDSIIKAPQTNDVFSFYLKTQFKDPQQEDGLFFDEEIADMVVDCSYGRMDTLSVARYFGKVLSGKRKFRNERSKRVKTDTLGETELRLICGKNLPRYIQQKNAPKIRSSQPWR